MSLKQKTITGLTWSFVDNTSSYFIQFVFGIIMARLLTPREFGLIGMMTVFIAVSQSFINSGFTQALIRKKNCTQIDFSTVFYFNLLAGITLYLILFSFSTKISLFYNEVQLKNLIQVVALELIITAFAVVQRARLTKEINFKLQTKISIIASIIAGSVGITMAYLGYGVWSLVIKTLTNSIISTILLWFWNKWKPTLEFSFNSLKELFSFGSKLLLSGIINTIYHNIYLLIIGKYFSAAELGYYTRADQFKNLPSQNLTSVIQRVSYPVLSTIQDEPDKLKSAYKRLIKSTMFLAFTSMILLAAIAKPLIIILIGEKWIPSVIYLQLLCFVGMSFPLQAINLNMLQVKGRSDLFLKLEIVKKLLAVPIIIIGIFIGIKAMIIGMFINTIIAYFLNSYYSGKYINYSSLQQLKDILPAFFLASVIGIIVFFIGYIVETTYFIKLMIQIAVGLILIFGLSELFKYESYFYIKSIFLDKVFKKN